MRNKRKIIKKSVQKISIRQAQDKQDEIFRKMSVAKKLKLASDFSMFLISLNKLGKSHGFSGVTDKNRKNS